MEAERHLGAVTDHAAAVFYHLRRQLSGTTDLYKLYWITAPLCWKNQCLLATSMRAYLLILKTLLIRRDLRNLLIKHAVQHHKCMPANNSSITNRYQFILNCVFPTRLCASGDVDV